MKTKIFVISLFTFILTACKSYPELKNSDFYKDLFSKSELTTTALYSVPKNYDSKKSYPLIVVLHGLGENAEAFGEIWKPTTDSLGFVLLSVQGETPISDAGHFSWGKNAEKHILQSIDQIKQKVNIDESNIFIAGFSAGGSLAYYLGLKYAMQFRGLVSISATFRKEYLNNSLVNSRNKIFIARGAEETSLVDQTDYIETVFSGKNVPVNIVTYEGIGHDIPKPWNKTITEIINYLE